MTYDFARYLNIRSAIMPGMIQNGRRVAFLTDMTGVYQIWRVAAPGADSANPAAHWPIQLTFFTDKVWELHATPAADHLIAVSDVGGNERQQFYLVANREDDVHDVRRLTDDDQAIHRFGAFSSDGRQVVYVSNARNHVDFDPYWMDLATGASRRLAAIAGNRTIVAWSPDETTLLMVDAQATEQHELYLVDLASGAERHLTAGRPPARYLALKWTERGLFTLSDRKRDRFALCRLDPDTAEALRASLDAADQDASSETPAEPPSGPTPIALPSGEAKSAVTPQAISLPNAEGSRVTPSVVAILSRMVEPDMSTVGLDAWNARDSDSPPPCVAELPEMVELLMLRVD